MPDFDPSKGNGGAANVKFAPDRLQFRRLSSFGSVPVS
jgi:hypothetical protein